MAEMIQTDERSIPDAREIRLFGKVRNEATRLPFFLSYYRKLGVERFIIVDNGSTDGTADFLGREPDCHVFLTNESMASSRGGMSWIEPLLAQYGRGRWCIVADADELLVYPESELLPLSILCSKLEQKCVDALPCIMLDMYPAGDIDHVTYEAAQSFIEACPFLDSRGYRWLSNSENGPTIVGGPRLRMFYPELLDRRLITRMRRWIRYHLGRVIPPVSPQSAPKLNKVPLVHWREGMTFEAAAHYLYGARLAQGNGALLHFKFLADFRDRVKEELVRKAYFQEGAEYARYYARFGSNAAINFVCPMSARYIGTRQLIALGLIRDAIE